MFESKVVKQEVVASSKSKSGHVFVSTCDTFDAGLETMVFECDTNGNVIDWGDIDKQHYESESEAQEGHAQMVSEWSAVIH